MIKELKEWLHNHLSHKGIDKDDLVMQKAFAIIIYHIIKADDVETPADKKRFATFFKNDFDLDEAHIHDLHDTAEKLDGDFEAYLEIISEKIADYPGVKLELMQTLNGIMQQGRFDEHEFAVFEQVREALFH